MRGALTASQPPGLTLTPDPKPPRKLGTNPNLPSPYSLYICKAYAEHMLKIIATKPIHLLG
jgi:hypothetical protein